MEEDQAVKFIERMFSHAAQDRMAILAIPRSGGKAEQRVFTLPQATSRKVQAWLRHMNARDYDIYLCVNPVRPGSGGREKGDIDDIRRLQLDLDEEGAAGLRPSPPKTWTGARCRARPTCLRSSKDRYQILWDTVPGEWEMEGAEAVMRALAQRYGGDRAATDVARVMRMPGFRNKKPGRSGALVTWAWHGGPLVRPEDFPGLAVSEPARRPGGRRRIAPGHHSQSERDWAAAGDALRSGEALEAVDLAPRATEAGQAESRLLRPPDGPAQGGGAQKVSCHDNPGKNRHRGRGYMMWRRVGRKKRSVFSLCCVFWGPGDR